MSSLEYECNAVDYYKIEQVVAHIRNGMLPWINPTTNVLHPLSLPTTLKFGT